MTLSNRIRELRFKNGEMTQMRLAEQAGVSRQSINAIENSRHAPTVGVAIRIADVFGITVDELFDFYYDGSLNAASQLRRLRLIDQRPTSGNRSILRLKTMRRTTKRSKKCAWRVCAT